VQRRGRHLDALPSNVASLLHQALRTSRGSADAWRSGWKCSRTATTARLAALTSTCTSFEIRVSSAGKGAAGNTTIEAEALQGALARMLQEPQPALDKVAVVRMNSNLHTSWGAQQCLIMPHSLSWQIITSSLQAPQWRGGDWLCLMNSVGFEDWVLR